MKVSPLSILRNKDREPISFYFGDGQRAEHRSGLDKYSELFGVGDAAGGLEQYTMTADVSKIIALEHLQYKGEWYSVFQFNTTQTMFTTKRRKHLYPEFAEKFILDYSEACKYGICSAWDQRQCVIIAHEKYRNDITDLFNAFMSKDILVCYCPKMKRKSIRLQFTIESKARSLDTDEEIIVDKCGEIPYEHVEAMITIRQQLLSRYLDTNKSIYTKEFDEQLKHIYQSYLQRKAN